jgi:uncharacterized protein involved in exopolysaccharide biosynthesis
MQSKDAEHILVVQQAPLSANDEIDLFSLCRIIKKGWIFIISFTLLSTTAAVMIAFFVLPVIYTSQAVLSPQGNTDPTGKLAGIIGNLPIPIDLSQGQDSGVMIGNFLESRTLK